MSKNSMVWVIAGVVVIAMLIFGGWWYFSKTKSITSVPIASPAANSQGSEKSITSFTFLGIDLNGNEQIDNTNHTVTIFVPYGTNVASLTPVISVSGSDTVSPASGIFQDFTNPVTYTVTAQDGSTQNYVVTVEILSNPATDMGS